MENRNIIIFLLNNFRKWDLNISRSILHVYAWISPEMYFLCLKSCRRSHSAHDCCSALRTFPWCKWYNISGATNVILPPFECRAWPPLPPPRANTQHDPRQYSTDCVWWTPPPLAGSTTHGCIALPARGATLPHIMKSQSGIKTEKIRWKDLKYTSKRYNGFELYFTEDAVKFSIFLINFSNY